MRYFWNNREVFPNTNKNVFSRGISLEHRYMIKIRPTQFNVRCPKCMCKAEIFSEYKAYETDTDSGALMLNKKITGPITGKITCTGCGMNKDKCTISWPKDAFYQFTIKGDTVWAWNKEYLMLINSWVGAKVRNEDTICSLGQHSFHWAYLHFLAILPKFMLLKKNRSIILKNISKFLDQ